MPDYRGLLERLAAFPKNTSGSPHDIITAYDDLANEAGRVLSQTPERARSPACNDPRHDEIESWYRQVLAARSTPAEALDVSEMAALHELERDLAAAEVEHMGDVWQRLRAILDGPQQRALAARLSSHNREAD